jgi:Ca-activated chloride channel family protein
MRPAYFLPLMLGLCACSVTPKPVATPKAEPNHALVAKHDSDAVVVTPTAAPAQDLVSLDSASGNSFVLADQRSELVVRVRIGAEQVQNAKQPPVNLALVVDTSGSMAGEAIKHARAASVALLHRLAAGDMLSVITFGSTAQALVPSTVISEHNRDEIRVKIEEMAAQGTTDMAGGLSVAMAQLQVRFQQQGINRVVLLGDGVPNDADPVLPLARSAGQRGISITALGLGLDYDETVMSKIASASGGTFQFVEKPERVAAVFDKEVLRLKRVVARGSWLTLTPGPGVTLDEALGQQAHRSGRGLRIQLGDLSEGQTRDIMVRLHVGGHRAGANVELFDAELSYQDALTGRGGLKERAFVSVRSTADKEEFSKARNSEVEHEATRMRVADMIVRAIAMARAGNLRAANAIVDEGMKLAKDGAKSFDDDELLAKVKEMTKLRASLPSLLPPPPPRHTFGMNESLRPKPRRSRPAPAPGAAFTVRKAHGSATRTLQGI